MVNHLPYFCKNIIYCSFLLNQFREPDKKKKKIPQVVADLKNDAETEFHQLPIVLVKSTYNNTLIYLTDHNG